MDRIRTEPAISSDRHDLMAHKQVERLCERINPDEIDISLLLISFSNNPTDLGCSESHSELYSVM